jgi:hypothetical protein
MAAGGVMSLVGGVVAGMLAMVAGKRDGDAVCARYGTTRHFMAQLRLSASHCPTLLVSEGSECSILSQIEVRCRFWIRRDLKQRRQ